GGTGLMSRQRSGQAFRANGLEDLPGMRTHQTWLAWLAAFAAFQCTSLPAHAAPAAADSWEGKSIILTRAGAGREGPQTEKIAPKTAGVAKDVTFQVVNDKDGRIRISSRRQEGWIAKSDAVLFDKAVAYFTERLARDPKDSHALAARGVVLSS